MILNCHGIRGTFGVHLARQSAWQGRGADLSPVDVLLLPACTVGRLQQDGTRDVEGLCAELDAHRGRTVIAARWPIADNETAIYTAEIVREYCEALDALNVDEANSLPAFARARALNRARRRLLQNESISWHLAAAFEIYGLG